MYQLWESLEKMKKLKWVELSHSLNNDSPYWSGIPEGSVELGKVVFDWGNPMLECRIQTFKFPGQFGTHIDFPGHFSKGGALSDAFGVKDAVFPLCVIDITQKVAEDCHYAVTAQDIRDYEAKYGPIPDGAFVALRTDWYKNWPDMDALSGIAEDGSENFPGWSLEALKYIYEVRNAAANGLLRNAMLANAKPNCRILHPLPRVNEIHVDVDANPKAYYFQQAQNGVYARQALIAAILGLK